MCGVEKVWWKRIKSNGKKKESLVNYIHTSSQDSQSYKYGFHDPQDGAMPNLSHAADGKW